jgi:alpha-L-fucosidase 2
MKRKIVSLGVLFLVAGFTAVPQGAGAQTVVGDVSGRSVRPPEASQPLMLWYAAPARFWTDALPVGNGRMGAMVFGRPAHERIQLNDVTVWGGGPQGDVNQSQAYRQLPEIRAALAAGEYAKAEKLTAEYLTSPAAYTASYQTLGDLVFDYALPSSQPTHYWRWLDLTRALTGVAFEAGGVTYRRETFASHPDHVIVTHITASRPRSITFTLQLTRAASATTTAIGTSTLMMVGTTDVPASLSPDHKMNPGQVHYEAQVKVLTSGGSVTARGGRIFVKDADAATVVLADGTDYALDYEHGYRGPDPHTGVVRTIAAATAKSYRALLAAHEADYQRLFNRVHFSLPETAASAAPTDVRIRNYGDGRADPSLAELYYQMGRYLMIAGSRADDPLPMNLQGIWGDGLAMPWNADYHDNINFQMFYWPSEVANLSETHMPALRFEAALEKPGEQTARAYFNAPGWAISYTTNAWGWTAPGAGMPWGPFFGAGGWLMRDVWEHYAFTRDRSFLAQYYPLMKHSAEFYLNILVRGADGRLSMSPSLSPENSFKTDKGVSGSVSDNTAIDREIVWDLFTNTIAAEKVLGVDTAFREKLQAALGDLRPLEIGKAGQIEEWGHDWDLNGELHHRHMSHLYGLFPGWEISSERTPQLAAAARVSMVLRGDASTGWSNAWKMNLWAHLHDGDHTMKLLSAQLQLVPGSDQPQWGEHGGSYANLFDVCPPFQIDGNFGSTSGIEEMLLQSSERYVDPIAPNEDRYYVDLLPALPTLWPEGSIEGLRARGGFAVSMHWHDGTLTTATIRSIAGSATMVRYRGQTVAVRLSPGGELRLRWIGGRLVH